MNDLISREALMDKMQKLDGVGGIYLWDPEQVKEVIEKAPTVDAIPVTSSELRHLINDTIAYLWRLEERGCNKPEFGYDDRKELLQKLKEFYEEHFPELECSDG